MTIGMCGIEIVKKSENCWDWNQSVWWSRRVDGVGLKMLNVKWVRRV